MQEQKTVLLERQEIIAEKAKEIQSIWQKGKIKSEAKSLAIFLGFFSLSVG